MTPHRDSVVATAQGRRNGRARAALTPALPAGHALARVLADYFETARANVPGIIADQDPECLHDFRTSMRRARSIVLNVRGVLPSDQRPAVKAAFAWMSALTGRLRDLDVLTGEWPRLVARLPAAHAAALPQVNARLAATRAAALTRVRRGLHSARWETFAHAWPAFLDELGRGRVGGHAAHQRIALVATRSVRRLHLELLEHIEQTDPAGALGPLHELRKLAKKLRYVIETFTPLYPLGLTEAPIESLKSLQDELGATCDRHVQCEFFGRWRARLARLAACEDGVLELLERLEADLQTEIAAPRPRVERALKRFRRPRTQRHFVWLVDAI